jgi:hypothetical protein
MTGGRPVYPEHAVQCPHCGASAGIRCTTRRGRKLSIPSHDARINAFTENDKTARETAPR